MMRIQLEEFDDGILEAFEVPMASPREWLGRTLDRMRQAQCRWSCRPVRERLAMIRQARGLIAERAGWLAAVAQGETSRPKAETLASQVLPLADACRFLEREAEFILGARPLGAKGRPGWLRHVQSTVKREPYGVVLVIAPSNYPLFLPAVAAIQALVAGNAVLLKPGHGGMPAAQALMQILREAGLDHDLLVVLAEAPEVAQDAIALGVDKVVFTGSAQTGELLLRQLAPSLIPATLELSGCDAVFVRSDADLELVAKALVFGLHLNNGATCIAPRRVFVHRSAATELEGRLAAGLAARKPITFSARAQEQSLEPLRRALAQGAHVVGGHIVPDGTIVGPLVLAGATPEMDLLRCDIFAPVLALVTVENDEEALDFAARCPYALGASIFSADGPASRRLAAQVRAGVVVINDLIVPTADPRVPFGGRGRSGYGVTRGAEGLLEMTLPKVIAVRRGRWRPHLEPVRPGDARLFESYLQLIHSRGWQRRASALLGLVRTLLMRRFASGGSEQIPGADEENY